MGDEGLPYRKTEAGLAELHQRRAGLDARSRAVLILCNGQHSQAELGRQLGPTTGVLLARLVAAGLVTDTLAPPVPGTTAQAAPGASPATALPGTHGLSSPPAAPAADTPAQLQRAVAVLQTLWGPGAGQRLQPLRQARDAAEFEAALQQLQQAIAVFQGRKRAQQLLLQIRQGR